jgi:hypothetical protein
MTSSFQPGKSDVGGFFLVYVICFLSYFYYFLFSLGNKI